MKVRFEKVNEYMTLLSEFRKSKSDELADRLDEVWLSLNVWEQDEIDMRLLRESDEE